MSDHYENGNGSFWGPRLMWTLVAMIVIIIGLAVLALCSPISKPTGERTVVLTSEATPLVGDLENSPDTEAIILSAEDFLDPEEIGHTDGIIFWGAILLLIMAAVTLRETILRKKK
ncbi:MAG TPA: hypothetical protein PLK74_09185 [Anaerolineaceae bacterium]|nr:hypothetical protein [Anaerolineaceae bacterium]HPL70303.1 hypothetical protein [Brevefilum sp.]